MRERLVIAFVALAVGIIALYGIPRAYMVADLVQSSEQRRVVRLADFLAVLMTEREAGNEVTEEFLEPLIVEGERITFTAADGRVVTAGVDPEPDDITATSELADGGTVEFSRSSEVIGERVQEALMPVVVIGVGLLLASAIVGVLLAGRLSDPFVRLAGTARELGRGRLSPPGDDLRIPEARAIDQALRTSAATLEDRIRREHEFAANASHQLRTPITALRLELEDLTLWKETTPEQRDQLEHAIQEIDRLSDAIGHLLDLARGGTPGADDWLPVDELLEDAADRWSAHADELDRTIEVVTTSELADAAAPAPAGQILDVLIHNALQHGRGDVTVSASTASAYVTVRVADEGERPIGNTVFQRTPGQSTNGGEGIGLALAAELAEALGGHLLLDSAPTTTFSLILPREQELTTD